MRATHVLLARGFLGRSLEELRRRSAIALSLEGVKGHAASRPLYDFTSADSIRSCILMSDGLIGGSSGSNLDLVATTPNASDQSTFTSSSGPPSSAKISTPSPSSYARFHGSISTSLPSDRPTIQRTGYAAFRTPDQAPTLLGRSVWDIDPYVYLALRIKSDGRSYFVNLQAETVEPTDLHQHRLFAKRPGQWETVLIRWNDFVRTNYGFVVEPQTELLRQKVRSVGVGLTDRVEGPFDLCIERVWATNDVEDGEVITQEDGLASELKNKKGERIRW